MPTYEYECLACGSRFERKQRMTDPALEECPSCRGAVRRIVTGGRGFLIRGRAGPQDRRAGDDGPECSLERTGTTCCGREERCGKPPCGSGR